MAKVSLGDLLIGAREARGMSRVALAKRVGLTTTHLIRLENEQHPNPRLDTLIHLSEQLGCTLDELASACGYARPRLPASDDAAIMAAADHLTRIQAELTRVQEKIAAITKSLDAQRARRTTTVSRRRK